MERPAEPGFRPPRGQSLYIGSAIGLLILGLVSIFSIGIYFLFVGVAMLSVGWTFKSRPWIAVGVLGGALSAVLVHILTAPLTCYDRVTAGSFGASEFSGCSRILLPDVQGLDTTAANLLALGLAAVGGILAGVLVSWAVRQALPKTA
ncbi:MAG: hypothetical protein ACRDH9_04605 [Actinomycetota bacterium]